VHLRPRVESRSRNTIRVTDGEVKDCTSVAGIYVANRNPVVFADCLQVTALLEPEYAAELSAMGLLGNHANPETVLSEMRYGNRGRSSRNRIVIASLLSYHNASSDN
jgi:hypothetical protein